MCSCLTVPPARSPGSVSHPACQGLCRAWEPAAPLPTCCLHAVSPGRPPRGPWASGSPRFMRFGKDNRAEHQEPGVSTWEAPPSTWQVFRDVTLHHQSRGCGRQGQTQLRGGFTERVSKPRPGHGGEWQLTWRGLSGGGVLVFKKQEQHVQRPRGSTRGREQAWGQRFRSSLRGGEAGLRLHSVSLGDPASRQRTGSLCQEAAWPTCSQSTLEHGRGRGLKKGPLDRRGKRQTVDTEATPVCLGQRIIVVVQSLGGV